jgi:hypothetical protein
MAINFSIIPNDWQHLEEIINYLGHRILSENKKMSDYLLADGSRSMAGNLDMDGNNITDGGTITGDTIVGGNVTTGLNPGHTHTDGSGGMTIDENTYIDVDVEGNMTFHDTITGSLLLAEASCPPIVNLSSTGLSDGNNDISIPNTSKMLVKWILIETDSTDWTFTVYTKDDYATKPWVLVKNRKGDYKLQWDCPYEDEDDTQEFHYNFTDNAGANTYNIRILGYKLR